MKKIFSILIYLFSISIICVAQKHNNDLPKRTVICGKIQHKEVDPNTREISAEVKDFRDRSTVFTGSINSDGTFKIELTLYATQDVESELFDKIILHPGDSIFINLDFWDYNYIKFSGDACIENEVLRKFSWIYADEIYYMKNKLDISSYKMYCDSLYEIDLAKFNEFTKKEKPSSEIALWIKNQIKIKYYESILSYPNYNFKWCDKADYNNWIDSTHFLTQVDSEFANYGMVIMNNEFYELLDYYDERKYCNSEGGTITFNFSEALDTTNFQQIQVAYSAYTDLCNSITSSLDYRLDTPDSTFYVKDIIYSIIKSPSIREPLFDFYKVIKSNLDNPHYASDAILNKMDVDGRNFLDSVICRNKGKVLFVDLWATWCGPCLEGLKEAKDIMPKYVNKDVGFIFICVSSKEDAWKVTLSRLGIGGKQYYSNEIQSSDILSALDAKGLPHYLLIDKQGNIVDQDCLDLKQSQNKINKLLNN